MLLDPPVFMQATSDGIPSKVVVAPQAATQSDDNQQYNRPAYDGSRFVNSQSVAANNVDNKPVLSQQAVSQPSAQTTTRAAARYQIANNGYRVQKNDTAWKIAERLRTDPSISIEQVMMALLRRNPEAFIQDNINGVKRGYILRMPDQQEIEAVGQQAALLQVREQYALWSEYRQGLTAKRLANKIARDGVKAPKAENTVKGQLTIASAAEGEASDGATSGRQNPDAELKQLRQDLSATAEELESGKLENQDLKDRLASLQTRMKKMERLLNLKDSDLANLQSDLTAKSTAPVADTMAKDDVAEVMPAAVDMQPEATMPTDEAADMAATEMAAELAAMAGDAVDTMDASVDGVMDAISSSQPEDVLFKDEMSTSMTPALDTAVAPAPVMPPVQPVELGDTDVMALIEDALRDPDNLPYIAGIPAIIVILVLLLFIRRKKAQASTAEEPVKELPETGDFDFDDIDLSDDSNSDFNATDEEDLSAQLDAFAEEAEVNDAEDVISLDDAQPSEDEIPKDDILAEADVYLAYGIHQQAEELLKTAITANPERDDYKIKLLETYFAAKDKDNFVARAEEIQATLKPESEEWLRVVAMGREIDATNEIFRHAGELKGFDVDDLIPEKPETDFDLGNAAADFDLGESAIEDDGFAQGLEDTSLADVSLDDISLDGDSTNLDLGSLDTTDADNFALNADGMDELDQELVAAGFDESENEIELAGSKGSSQKNEIDDLEDGFSLDFEMSDLGLDEASAEVSLEETEVVATAMEPDTGDISFDLSDDTAAGTESLDSDLAMDLDDLATEPEAKKAESADDISLDMGDIDLGNIDLAADETDDISLDMADIDLSMDSDLPADSGLDLGATSIAADDDATVIHSTPEEDDETIDIDTLPEDLDEVNTKLDLAKAYIDMGDGDGAASILREVIEEGADAQKQTAEELLKNIA